MLTRPFPRDRFPESSVEGRGGMGHASMHRCVLLGLLGVKLLLQQDTELLLQGLQFVQVLLVLALVLDLGLNSLEDSHSGGVIVDPSRGLESSLDDGGGGDESVVQIALGRLC